MTTENATSARAPGSIARLAGFYAVACGWTWPCWVAILAEKEGWLDLQGNTERLGTLGQFGPFGSALLWSWIESGRAGPVDLLKRMIQFRVSPACLLTALALPPLIFFVAIQINVWLGGQPPPKYSFPEPVGTVLHFLLILAFGGPLGEEPAWRGYALPRLRERCGALVGSLILALAWACWHWPLWFIADVPSSFPMYVLGLVPLTIIFTWLDEWGKGSVLVALLCHASLNTAFVRLPIFPAILIANGLFWLIAIPIVISRGRAWLKPPGPKQ